MGMAHIRDTNDNKWRQACKARATPRPSRTGIQTATATLEDSLVVSYKNQHSPTAPSSNAVPWYRAKGVENLRPHQHLHVEVSSSIIQNCRHLEATKTPFRR